MANMAGMSGGGGMAGEGTLPQGQEDQMQLGIRIIQTAHASKVNTLSHEIHALKIQCEEQRANLTNMQVKCSSLQVELVESHQRSQQLAEENKELFKTVGSLRKQLGRLESLKNSIISTVQEDDEKSAEFGDAKALTSADYLNSATPLTASYATGVGLRSLPQGNMGVGMANVGMMQQQMHGQYVAHDPHGGMGGMGMMGGAVGGGVSPVPPSPAGSASGAFPASPGVIDGKAFFRQARGKLSYEAFNQFLQSIKRLNSQQQTREETLDEAKRIFGPSLSELYMDFENLLNRQAGPM